VSGVLAAVANSRTQFVYSISLGSVEAGGRTQYGYSSGSYGTITTDSFRGLTIGSIRANAISFSQARDFTVTLEDDSAPSADSLFEVVVETTAGTFRRYAVADATTNTFGADRFFMWGDGSDPPWTATTPNPRSVRLSY
jgi:hypothetical protein